MKAPFPLTLFLIPCLLLASGLWVRGFDEPQFSQVTFSSDGIFLEAQEKESLLGGLVAIASNFDDQSRIDEDLKEKAMAVALSLDPLHYQSRAAYRNLMRGQPAAPTPFFKSLSTVSETLWAAASRMLKEPVEPEEGKLAALLIDISLVIHPDPPVDRIRQLAAATEGKPIPWEKFIVLQSNESKSTLRSESLMREGRELWRAEKLRMAANQKAKPSLPAKELPRPPQPDPPKKALPPFDPVSSSLPAVVKILAVENSFVAGEMTFTLRSPGGEVEREMFPFLGQSPPAEYPSLPIVTHPDSVPISGIRLLPKFLQEQSLSWPANAVGEFHFTTEDALPAAKRLVRVKNGPWVPTLISMAIRELTANDGYAFTEVVAKSNEIADLIGAATPLKKPYLLIPEANFDVLVNYVHANNAPEILFDSEIITYTSSEEAFQFLSSDFPVSLTNASVAFAEIRKASERMSLTELARFPSAQERLEAIVNQFKNHGSARALLEFGRRPVSQKNAVMESLNAVTDAVEPFFELEDQDYDKEGLKRKLETADFALSKMRAAVHPSVRDYHGQAEDLVEEAELYLNLSNTGTSIATQRLGNIHSLINQMRAEKASILASIPD